LQVDWWQEIDKNKKYRIAVAGTEYFGLSMAVLLSQHNHVFYYQYHKGLS